MDSSFPNFLGIGAVRGGSTWLYDLLKSHPQIFMPSKRKEIQFFTRFYDKGVGWYRGLFETNQEYATLRGEITPGYLAASDVPRRIAQLGSVTKFILILRDPVLRAFSHYKWHLRVTGKNLTFEDFYTQSPRLALENGMYYACLKKYLEYFEKSQFLILISEEVFEFPERAISRLSEFLNVSAEDFLIPAKTNESSIPMFRKAFKVAHKITVYLRKYDLDVIPNLVIWLGGKKLLGKSQKKSLDPVLERKDMERLKSIFEQDRMQLEKWMGRKIDVWS